MSKPNFNYERMLWRKGYQFVAGVDEVGRGAFAGPIVVGAVVFDKSIMGSESTTGTKGTNKSRDTRDTRDSRATLENLGINDSKLLKPRIREQLAREIKEKALAWDVTEVGVSVINRIGIGKATKKAMRKTIGDLREKLGGGRIDFVLIDYFYVPYLKGVGKKKQKGIKHGDQKSFSIAAASILAKVHRDKLMRSLARKPQYRKYLWGKNKGYGTKVHRKAILRYGLTRYHRKAFVETWREKQKG